MVERPIKKSERQAKTELDNSSEPTESRVTEKPSRDRAPRNKDKDKDKGKKKGKGNSRDGGEPKQAVNPALVRGPRPVKAQPVVEEPPVEEVSAEAEQPETDSETTAPETTAEDPQETPVGS